MEKLTAMEMRNGRSFLGRLPHGKDIITSISEFCEENSIQTAAFNIIGAVSLATIGFYDQKQKVYVSLLQEGDLEIVNCTGNISTKDGKPFVHGHITLGDTEGSLIGGHLFSDTIVFAGEIHILELLDGSLVREYDTTTGLMLWEME